ncbi:dihydrodiol dehydrogenase 3-like isoform X1 [Diabrotica virgifera virgifera]|uniref:NADP-dependent oxidoreductase domain-containing protein n=1 Tax=Diabrotica virgifera virgifera TaxID=50390 RepID=A0ABM5JHM9_DIAVI|nr:dihydrodiol dehydrogenase 3-like isoform X1 [Diabrotica virgifera virgifera]
MANSETFRVLEEGFKIPTIGLGTAYQESDDVVQEAVDAALEIGYRHIDTAFWYNTEKNIGQVLIKWLSSGRIKREEIFVTTKLPFQGAHAEAVEPFLKKSLENLQLDYVDLYLIHYPVAFKYEGVDKFTPEPVETDHISLWKGAHAEAVEPFLKKSLENLQLDYVDLYLIHYPVAFKYEGVDKFTPEPVETDHISLWKKMEEQVEAGRTKFIGVSNFNISQIKKIIKIATLKPVCSQVEMHASFQNQDHVNFCKDNNIVVTAYSPLGTPNLGQFLDENLKKAIKQPNLLNDATVRKIAEKHHKTSAQVLLRFLIQKDVCVIPKSSNPNRIKENFQVFDFKLDNRDMKMLENLDKGEEGRVVDLAIFFPQLKENAEYPF